jgi:CRP/FNR family transcriptional regulator
VRRLALCTALSKDELTEISTIVRPVTLAPGQTLIHEGDPAKHVFIVQSGALKIFKLLHDGRRQVVAFLFPGDFLGIVDRPSYAYGAEAIGHVHICRFSRSEFDDLLARFRGLQKRLFAVARHELNAAQDQMVLLGRKTAREKVVSFLITFSNYAAKSGRPDNLITIPVARQDIGDYLGLTMETVSRTFTALKRERLITSLSNGQVRLNDKKQLSDISNQI